MNSGSNVSFDNFFGNNQTIDLKDEIRFDASRINMNLFESIAIFVVWILLQAFGNGMLIGMILYEREGNGDPLKRRIIDQVMINSFIAEIEKEISKGELFLKFNTKLGYPPLFLPNHSNLSFPLSQFLIFHHQDKYSFFVLIFSNCGRPSKKRGISWFGFELWK